MQEVTRIPLEGVHNTRDLGGYITIDGKTIQPHRLIRSGTLYNLTEKDKEILTKEYFLKTIVDFRTEAEKKEKPDPMIEEVRYIENPIFEEKAMGITREKEADKDLIDTIMNQIKEGNSTITEYIESLYKELATSDFCKKQYASFFDILINHGEGAVLWHCTAGKDRVGTGTALLLTVLGIPREQILKDYMKVNEFAAQEIEHTIQKFSEKTKEKELVESIRPLFGVQESYITSVFTFIEKEYDTVERFLQEEMNLHKDGIGELKNKYLA